MCHALNDADAVIADNALKVVVNQFKVLVVASDNDVLVLLLHHFQITTA
jgi:5'-3' exonuclease